MKRRLTDLDTIVASLKPYLPQYLQEHGINIEQNFSCINPKHEDHNPSMTCQQVPEQAFCFGCGLSCDIFAAAHYLEGKPLKGRAWIEENLLYLAKKYNVDVGLEDLTPEEIYEYKTYNAYALAAELVADPSFGDYSKVETEINRRGWDLEKLTEWGIGTVNYAEYRDRMKKAGFEPGFLGGIDLDRSNLFDNRNLLFTVYDENGRPVGFSAKNLNYKEGDKRAGPKYINTRVTGLECAIFKKSKRLYGFEIAKEANTPLYIFEGQADVITARHHGIMNCCCTLGTVFTDNHIDLLKNSGIFHLVFVFDGDKAGDQAIQKLLDDKFAGNRDFRIRLIQLPVGMDPDELLRQQGTDEFFRLKKWSAFDWRMAKLMERQEEAEVEDEEAAGQEVAEKMVPIIVSEPSYLRQEGMAKTVARMSGLDVSTVMAEVKRLRSEKEHDVQTKKISAAEVTLRRIRENPDEAELALAECQMTMEDISKSADPESAGTGTVLNFIISQKEADEKKSGEFAGYFMDPNGLATIARRLNDDWKSGTLMFIAGSSQAGKTTLSAQMAYEIADNNKNDAICIYHSIDDAAKFILYKWVCRAAPGIDLELNHVSNPNYWLRQPGYNWVSDKREKAYKKIIKMITDDKLILKDASDGPSLAYIENVIKYYRTKYPSKNIVLFVDNFHKLPDHGEVRGPERIKKLSNQIKLMTVKNKITVVATAEYRKLAIGQKRATNEDLADTRSIRYDASIVLHLYNDSHEKGDEALYVHEHKGEFLPRIRCKFGKNKVSGFEGREFFDLFPSAATLQPVDLDTALKEQDERRLLLAGNNKKL